jgi:hypothetical protein
MFWKENEHILPALAGLARDILTIPATGAGVERLFNSARDVCHYRRGSLKPTTIQELMMYMFTSKFEMLDEERLLLNEYLSFEEVQAEGEERDSRANDLDPISDNEEEDIVVEMIQPSEVVLGKRRRSVVTDDDENDDNDDDHDDGTDLPVNRTTGRARVRSKLLDGYETTFR